MNALRVNKADDPLQLGDMLVLPNAQVAAEMRPSGTTADASTITSPAPPCARLPRCTRCQSVANPSCDEYWHIGETPIRFLNVIERSGKAEKRG